LSNYYFPLIYADIIIFVTILYYSIVIKLMWKLYYVLYYTIEGNLV